MENEIKGAGPFDACDAVEFFCFFLAELFSLPDRDVLVGLADEKNFAILRIHRIGHEQQNRFLLINAAQIKQVAVLPKRHRAVGIGWVDIVGM